MEEVDWVNSRHSNLPKLFNQPFLPFLPGGLNFTGMADGVVCLRHGTFPSHITLTYPTPPPSLTLHLGMLYSILRGEGGYPGGLPLGLTGMNETCVLAARIGARSDEPDDRVVEERGTD